MGGEGHLRPSSWKAEAIRRGDLKISGPIPITEDVPLNEDEEREYAQKHNMDASPPISDKSSLQPAQLPSPPDPPSNPGENGAVHPVSTQLAGQSRFKEDPQTVKQQTPSPDPKDNDMQRQSFPEPVMPSTPSPFPSLPDTNAKSTPKKKRKSGLRNVFRKMFGKSSREVEEPSRQQETPTPRQGHGHHRSEPVMARESQERAKGNATHPQLSGLQVRELEPINPLGQHLPFPMNVNAPQDTSPTHEYLTFEVPPQPDRRRATLPSLELSQQEVQALAAAIVSSQHLPPWDEQQRDGESAISPQIGIALSSPPHTASSVQSKRRSRSAGAIRDLAKARPSVERRRSDEIRYWRSSYQSGSIYSTATPRPRTTETARTVDTLEPPAEVPELVAESKDTLHAVAQHDQDISEIPLPLPVESFDFGNLKNGFSDSEREEPEPEVSTGSHRRLSIEDRMRHLEDNMRDLKSSVRRISGRSNRQTIILENAPKGRRSRNRSSSATSDRPGSSRSKSTNRTLNVTQEGSRPTSPIQAPLSAVNEFPSSGDRHRTLIAAEPGALPRPATAPEPPHTNLVEQFSKVYEVLKHEREARRTLERQVDNLQREVQELHAIVNKFISQSPSYPTPSPDAIITAHEEQLSTPRVRHHPDHIDLGESDEETPGKNRGIRETIISRFSQSDSEGGGPNLASSKEDVTSPDVWATPEESKFGGGFFGRKQNYVDEAEFF